MSIWPRSFDQAKSKARFSPINIGQFDTRLYTVFLDENALFYGAQDNLMEDPTFVHELAHFIQHATTPYGFYLNQLDRYQNRCVKQFCEDYLSLFPDSFIYYPFLEWLEGIDRKAYKRVENSKEKHIDPWIHAEFHRQVLEGEIDSEQMDSIGSYMAIHGEEKITVRDTQNTSCPKVQNSIELIGASQISEYFATQLENIALQTMDNYDPGKMDYDQEFDLRILSGGYSKLFRLFYDDTGFMSPRKFFTLTLALCDIALFTPLDPIFWTLWSTETTWEDLHPGWRLVKAINSLDEIEPLKLDNRKDYERFADELCGILNWPTVTRMIDTVCSHRIRESDPVGIVFEKACEMRRKQPTLFVFPLYVENWELLVHEFLINYLPVIDLGGKKVGFQGSFGDRGFYFGATIATSVSRQLMLANEVGKYVPEELVRVFSEEGIRDPEDWIFQHTFGFSKSKLKPWYRAE